MTAETTARETHFVHPTSGCTLCAELIIDGWIPVASGSSPQVTCQQCHTQRYWLPAAGLLERGTHLETVEEPWPAGVRKHVVGDDDPGRGRRARPENLQLCLTCTDLRGPYNSHGLYDNLCACDYDQWDRTPKPQFGDLQRNAHLCYSCVASIVPSGTRWSVYYCEQCRPAIVLCRERTGRNIVPLGPHSIMNGVSWSSSNGKGMTMVQAVAFHDQLQALFSEQKSLRELNRTRIKDLANQLAFEGHAVQARGFTHACRQSGRTAEDGFVDLIEQLGTGGGGELAREIWRRASEAKR